MARRNRFKYTKQHLNFLRVKYKSLKVEDLTEAFNIRFGLEKAESEIKSTLTNHKITCGRKGKDRFINHRRLFTEEQEKFIRKKYKNISVAELTSLFNARFKANKKTMFQIRCFVHNHGINSGRTGHFEKGHKPWNTGTKGLTGRNKTTFKKGHIPKNTRPLGSERICPKDGFILIKVAEKNPHTGTPTRFKHKHVHVYEQENGPVPKGMVVAFKDGNKLNCEPGNLMLISRAELLHLNRHGYKDISDELKPTLRVIAKIEVAVSKLQQHGEY